MNPIATILAKRVDNADLRVATTLVEHLVTWDFVVRAIRPSIDYYGIELLVDRLPDTPQETPLAADHLRILVCRGQYYLGGTESPALWHIGCPWDPAAVIGHLAWLYARGVAHQPDLARPPVRQR